MTFVRLSISVETQEFQCQEDFSDAQNVHAKADPEDLKKVRTPIVVKLKNVILDVQNVLLFPDQKGRRPISSG